MLLGKIKIYDIAKELDLTSKEVIEIAQKLKIEAKSHLSSVDEEDVKRIKENVKSKEKKKEDKKVNTEKQEKKADKNNSPVIIRREVIISDESNTQKENSKKVEKKNNNIGFVERKQNKDYNIVYRNKPSKPMTVDELFGIKKEPEKENVVQKVEEKIEEKVEIEENKMDVEIKKQEPVVKNVLEKKAEGNNINNKEHKTNNFNNRNNNNNQNGNFQNRNRFNKDRNNNHFDRNNNQRFGNRNNPNNNNNKFENKNRQGGNQRFGGNRPLDERGIEKNIKDIMSVETMEKETSREYNKSIDKQKENNRFEENRGNKKNNKSRRNQQNGEINEHKLKGLKRADRLSNMFDEQDGGMLDYYDLTTQRGKKGKKKIVKDDESRTKQKIFKLEEITIPETITVKDFAIELKKTTAEVIKKLLGYGVMATINNEIDFDTATLIADEFGVKVNKKETISEEDILFDESEDREEDLEPRPPVIVVMGHVDHGKTSLLDAVKKTNVIEGEAGGITQHIGAYKVKVNDREITFLDTPGHEAFTAMRARGAQITDIAILVVAANDGVMPQTIEAINHAKSAGIPIIVAINKIDLPDANIEKVKQELMAYELVPEEWGGNTIFVPISARNNQNIDQLLEMVLLEADMLELKANPHKQAKGVVIEARLDKNKGAVASILIQRGTLDVGDTIIVGSSIGRIRSMTDEKGKSLKKAGPSTPVEIMGLTEVPQAGDTFYEVENEKVAKHLIEKRKRQEREKAMNDSSKVTLDNLFSQMEEGHLKTLNLIVKADVQGSVEAIKQSMEKLSNEEVKVKVIHAAAGAVTESDVTLAKVSNAIIIAFNVRPMPTAKDMAEKEEVQIKQYSVIYQAIDDVESAMKGMLAPKFEEKVIGNAEIRQTFKISNVGTIGGAYVTDGKLERYEGVRILRDYIVIHDGKLSSLKRIKDDVKEVTKGYECGIQIEKFNDIKEGDIIEAYILEEIKR